MEEHMHHHDHHDHGHDHEHHHHHHENIEITTHEDAVIASVRMSLPGSREEAETVLKSFMRAVAEETEGLGGTIGHIKFFLKESSGAMYSMTDTEDIQKKTALSVPRALLECSALLRSSWKRQWRYTIREQSETRLQRF